ncbi:MAG: hypothetical protein JSV83_22090 [Desulfobacterales bacterium]|nr:MAG: hypothetical protein JSV83_22090 [Desulfobacterales bacterium]
MITSTVSNDHIAPEMSQFGKNAKVAGHKINSPQKTNGVKAETITSVKINDSLFEFSVPQSARSAINMIAASVRRADLAMLEIEKQIDQMKARLTEHVKNFPPFLSGSDERVKLMKRFSAFRQQINQLTFPPDNPGAEHIMADPSTTGPAGDWNVDIDDNQNHMTIQRQPVHTGTEGLDIAELRETATDEEIHAALESLDSAKESLGHRRSGLAADFKQILNQMKIGV